MLLSDLDAKVISEIEELGQYHRADGVVISDMSLEEVVAAIANQGSLTLDYLHVSGGRKIRYVDGGWELVASCSVTSGSFVKFRDLVIQPGGRGVFEVTATYEWCHEWDGNYGPRRDFGSVDFRFHVNRAGRATYVSL